MNTVAYIRVSTEEQAKEGYSIPAQKERLDAFAKSQGWTITEYYIEEGRSGKDLERPAAQKMLADITEGNIEIVLVYRLDRLTRSVIDLHTLLQLFEKHQVAFRSVTEIYDTTTATGRLFITLVAAMAQWERENLGERVYFGMSEMVKQGRRPGTKEPYGYTYNKEKKVLDVNPGEAKVIRQIYDMYLKGDGIRKIVRSLNESQIPTKFGKTWADNTISHILKNPLYLGSFRWDGEKFDGGHTAILDENTWLSVQEKMVRKKKLPPRHASGNYPLTGILKCGLCGTSLNGSVSTQKNMQGKRKVRWYKCGRRDHKQDCDLPYFRAETVENQVLEWIGKASNLDALQEMAKAKANDSNVLDEVNALEAELRGAGLKKKKWFDAYEAGVIGVPDLNNRLKSITEREEYARTRLKELSFEQPEWTKKERLKKIQNFRWLWENANPQERKELAHELIKSITAGKNKTISIELN